MGLQWDQRGSAHILHGLRLFPKVKLPLHRLIPAVPVITQVLACSDSAGETRSGLHWDVGISICSRDS